VAGYLLAPHSLQAVRASRSLARAAGDDGGLTDSEDWVVERLAVEHLGTDTVDLLIQELIGNLLEYDRRRGTHLLETLEQWLRSGCNTAETARALFLERQSMHSRLTRIFELIGGDPRGTPRMAGLALAARLACHPVFAAPDRAAE
jgi:purine catabolism regulator